MIKKIFDKYNSSTIQAKASLWFLICAFLQKGISIISTPIFTRLLSTEEYGQYSVFVSWTSIATVFVSLNLYFGVYTQGLVKFESERKEYSSSLQGLTFTLVGIWSVIYLLFQEFWNKLFTLTSTQMLLMLIMIWTTAIFNFWSMEQRVDFKYKKLVIITIIVSIAKPLISILFIQLAKDKVTARIWGIVIVEMIMYFGLFVSQLYNGKKFFSKKFWSYALKFNLPLIPHYLASSVLGSTDRIMIKNMIGNEEVGIYSLAYSVSQIMVIFNTALLQTIEPWIYKKIKAKKVDDIKKVAYPSLIGIAIVNIILIAFAPEIITIFAPASYKNAIWVVPPIAMSVYFMFAYSFFAAFEFYYEKTNYISFATMIAAILNIILNYIFLKLYGYYAAAYTTLLCYIFYAVYHFYFMRKICKVNLDGALIYDIKILSFISVAFMGLGFLFLLTYSYVSIRYVSILLIFIIMFIKRKAILDFINEVLALKK